MNLLNTSLIAGIDEAGRGCLAGPVVAAVVALPEKYSLPFLNDSKKLSPSRRDCLEIQIKKVAVSWSIGVAWPREIEEKNILRATLCAMKRAYEHMKRRCDIVYVDGIYAPEIDTKEIICVKGGDKLIPQISAASIIAKTFRDRLMCSLDKKYPGYGFSIHKGYGTKYHLERLKELGPCELHRRTFKGVKEFFREELCLPNLG